MGKKAIQIGQEKDRAKGVLIGIEVAILSVYLLQLKHVPHR